MTENQDNSLALHHDVVEDQSQSLPRARRDVEWTEQVYYGKGCYVLKDPTTLRYYRLRPPEYTIYTMLDGKNTMEDVLAALRDRFPSEQYDAHAVMSFLIMLRGAALLHIPGERDTDYLLKRKETLTRGLLKRLTQEYLFFRIPVFDPDKLLNAMMRTIGGVIFSRVTGFLVLCMLGGAVLLVLNNIDKLGEARPILSWENMLLMVPTLLVIKLIHEFGHGLSAKYFGSEVHEMGVLFLVFAPFFYCDVSDAWMIPAKRKRMWITAAGVVVEMVLAGFSAYIWAFTESGTVINQFALNAMIAASVNTLFFNGNPLLRYDGYYFMMDLVEIPNLKQKGASYLWYLMQKYVLGVENPPETLDVKGREMLVIIYSVASFCYRCLIMVAIITLVWTFLDPYGWGIVGAVLAAVAIYSSLLQPLFNFVKFTFTQRHRIHIRLASTIVLVLVLGAIAYGVLGFPVEQSVEAQCVLRPAKLHLLYVTQPGFLEIDPEGQVLDDGQLVKEGQVLLRLHDPDLEVQARNLELERQKLVEQREQARNRQNSADDKRIGFQLEGVQAQLEQAQEQLNRLVLRSPIDGRVQWRTQEKLSNMDGRFVPLRTPLLGVYQEGQFEAVAAISHRDHGPIDPQQAVEIKFWALDGEVFTSHVVEKPPQEVKRMSSPIFSTLYGGEVPTMPTRSPEEALEPAEPTYELELPLADEQGRLRDGMVGRAKVIIGKETLWGRFSRWFLQTLRQDIRL